MSPANEKPVDSQSQAKQDAARASQETNVPFHDTQPQRIDFRIQGAKALEGKPFGKYLIERTLGQGGMGAVFLATDTVLGRRVALKMPLFQDEDTRQEQLDRFQREARLAASFNHQSICAVHDTGEIDGQPFIAMAYLEGQTLYEVLKKLGKLKAADALRLTLRLAEALAHMHDKKIVHRDLKPQNIMVSPTGMPVLMDFGLAFGMNATRLTQQSGTAMGTPMYMPPEQIEGQRSLQDERADVYSLGVILYEMITGQPPYCAENLAELFFKKLNTDPTPPTVHLPGINAAVERLILKAIARDLAGRHANMLEFLADLNRFRKQTPNAAGATMVLPTSGETTSTTAPPTALFESAANYSLLNATAPPETQPPPTLLLPGKPPLTLVASRTTSTPPPPTPAPTKPKPEAKVTLPPPPSRSWRMFIVAPLLLGLAGSGIVGAWYWLRPKATDVAAVTTPSSDQAEPVHLVEITPAPESATPAKPPTDRDRILEVLQQHVDNDDANLTPQQVQEIEPLLNDPDKQVRYQATYALAKADHRPGITAAKAYVANEGADPERLYELCLVLLKLAPSNDAAAVIARISKQPQLLKHFDEDLLKQSLTQFPQMWEPALLAVISHQGSAPALLAVEWMCGKSDGRPLEWSRELARRCKEGAVRQSLEEVVILLAVSDWREGMEVIPDLLRMNDAMHLDDIEVPELDRLLQMCPPAAKPLATHLVFHGLPDQVRWALSKIVEREIAVNDLEFKNLLKRPVRSSREYVLSVFLSLGGSKSMEYAQAMLNEPNSLQGEEIDVTQLTPDVMQNKELMGRLHEIKWKTDSVGKAWALQQALGPETVRKLCGAERHYEPLHRVATELTGLVGAKGKLTSISKDRLAILQSQVKEFSFTAARRDIGDAAPDLTKSRGSFKEINDAALLIKTRLETLRSLTEDTDALVKLVDEQRKSTSGQISESVLDESRRLDSLVTDRLTKLKGLDEQIEPIVAMLPDFPRMGSSPDADPAAKPAKVAGQPRPLARCLKCNDTGALSCNCTRGIRECSRCKGKGFIVRTGTVIGSGSDSIGRPSSFGGKTQDRESCFKCRGDGRIDCMACNGSMRKPCTCPLGKGR